MPEAPLPPREEERVRALERYQILDTLPEQAFDDITLLASTICGTPIALISLVDAGRQWFKSKVGLEAIETTRDLAFCAHAILEPDDVLQVSDATRDDRFADNALVLDEPEIRFYAGAPLVTEGGLALGTICVLDRAPRQLEEQQLLALRALSRQVMAQLELRVNIRRLNQKKVELEEYRDRLERSIRDLDDFAFVVSHDLKEPLRGIRNYSEFLEEDYGEQLDEDGREKLTTLKRLSSRMNDLISALLDLSRAGREELAIEETDSNHVLAAVIDSLEIGLRAAKVEVRIPAALPMLRCDRTRLAEVFRNLISNAMKYNDKPEKWIEIGCEEKSDGPVFFVRDNGIGVPEEHREKIFGMFKRLHARDQFGGGTGSGLAIAQKLVTRHGGRVWVESTPGVGSTFRFTISALAEPNDPAETPELSCVE